MAPHCKKQEANDTCTNYHRHRLYYADDIVLLANTPTQGKSLLHSLEKTAGGIDKMEYMCFNENQSGDISTLKDISLKLVDKFTCFRSSVSSTENDINTWLANAWSAIKRLSVIWNHTYLIRWNNFLPSNGRVHTTIGYSLEYMLNAMDIRDDWQERVRGICTNGMTWWWWGWQYHVTKAVHVVNTVVSSITTVGVMAHCT